MGAEVLVDASGWYAAAVRRDPHHETVKRVLQDMLRSAHRLVTTNLVVAETHALLLKRHGGTAALAFLDSVFQPPTVVVPSTSELEGQAVTEWLERYADQDFSFTDAVSFAVMRERRIDTALTLDRHFAAAGFRMVPR